MATEQAATTIDQGEYFKLIGLVTLARAHTATLDALERTMMAITGEPVSVAGGGHSTDVLYERDDPRAAIDRLLDKLGITVEGGG